MAKSWPTRVMMSSLDRMTHETTRAVVSRGTRGVPTDWKRAADVSWRATRSRATYRSPYRMHVQYTVIENKNTELYLNTE